MNQIEKMKYFAFDIPEVVKMYHYAGDFKGELRAIEAFLSRDNVPDVLRTRLELQKLTAEVLMNDYVLTDEDAVRILNSRQDKRVITVSDLDAICKFQNVDYILVNGERRWERQQMSNILNQHYSFFSGNYEKATTFDNSTIEKMAEKGGMAWKYKCAAWMKINEKSLREGEKVRIWLPFPTVNETQRADEMRVINCSHPYKITGDTLRSAFIETETEKDAEYYVTYEFVNRARYNAPEKVIASQMTFEDLKKSISPEEYERYTREEYPQNVFSPFMKALAAEITEGLTKPGEMAYAIYTWITNHIKYSYLRTYLIIPNIPEFVAINGYGDCGAMTLLFMTLCRICGIPARWQSGNGVSPGHMGSHDWCRFYHPEFGWLYCDTSYGAGAYNSGNEKRRLHYFCNIDAFRNVADDDFMVDLTPGKVMTRMDPYDNQSGEAEYADGVHNLFYGDVECRKETLEATEIDF